MMKGKEYTDVYDIETNPHLIGKKADGRLYQTYHLYSEGLRRPSLRGRLHLFSAAVLFTFAIWHLTGEANDNFWGKFAAIVYLSTNIFCYGISGLYHCWIWSPKTEILLQKLDHVGIALLSCGTCVSAPIPHSLCQTSSDFLSFFGYVVHPLPVHPGYSLFAGTFVPMQLLLIGPYAPNMAVLFFSMALSCCLWVAYNIFYKLSPSVTRQVLVVATLIPFMPLLFPLMNDLELLCMGLTIFFKLLGTLVYTYERPSPWPTVFGFHEVFHTFVVRFPRIIITHTMIPLYL